MRIILTHEQADFDAIASLLAAHLLDEAAIAVLPRKMNRNVRAFLTLYGADLPFVDPRDLPNEPVEAVTLVDTQSLVSVKGMSKATRVHVIDHHPLREDISPDWSITVSATGANTTLIIEAIQERDRDEMLGIVQATLLLLGIYEDTGSLMYTQTTVRDLRAAGYLLEQGASLQIAADFLNHPLSKQQQELYDRLRGSAEIYPIQGSTLVITSSDGTDIDEELSTVAHKLRDLLDPDALFLLVKTRGGVQLIARSTSDNIDVSAIATHFGGGGHNRASASLIKDRELEDVQRELVAILPDYIRPSVVVAQIMSPGPQLLSPDTPAEEAARRMQRYGYEGYPVVREGRVIGLLTRRAVDRALSHKLNLTAASLMEAGEYTVQPGDSIEYLQRLMTDSGWGQIPVVDPENGDIIGIVTRTDLLKTLTKQPSSPGRQDLAKKLNSALSPARLALLRAVAQVAHEQHCALYIVGGFVRDLLLDRPGLDFDLVVEGDAIGLAHALAGRYGGRVTGHSRFGTAKWIIRGIHSDLAKKLQLAVNIWKDLPGSLDLVTARTEFYTHPSALPTVERSSIKLDLHRRDFTINTLALRLDGTHWGELYDYWGGLNDLRRSLVRVLHSLSFVDDPTRILRAVRFEQRFSFRIETRTLELLKEAATLLDRVSGDRIRHELNTILVEERAVQMLSRLNELGLFKAIHPDLVWDPWLREKIGGLPVDDGKNALDFGEQASVTLSGSETRRDITYILWLLRLSPGSARRVAARLKLPTDLTRAILAAVDLWPRLSSLAGAAPSKVVALLNGAPLLAIIALYQALDRPELKDILYTYVERWQHVSPTVDGNSLRARGLKPGPHFRSILLALRDAWLDGEVTNARQEAELLDKLIVKLTGR
jgi:tRNA nucleotidyltransferase (CCA-adding enzyme)